MNDPADSHAASQTPAASDQLGQPGATGREVFPLLVLFGGLYFIQGFVEPATGLFSQPLQSRLGLWNLSAGWIGQFMGIISIPWSLKPLFGLLTDFLPIGGRRRTPYLLVSTLAAALAFGWLGLTWQGPSGVVWAGGILVLATAAVAMTDVVIDAASVEIGQPRRITGQLQAVQWGALSLATVVAGSLGGLIAQRGLLNAAFMASAMLSLAGLAVVLLAFREPARTTPAQTASGRHADLASGRREPPDGIALPTHRGADAPRSPLTAWSQLRSGRRLAALAAVAAFLFLWNFNPFSSTVHQLYMTKELGLSEQFYGHMSSLSSLANFAACVAYFWICSRVPPGRLIHLSIAAGIVATLCYLPMQGVWTAAAASVVFGLAYQLGLLVQVDLAARICPTEWAGTTFAVLMAVGNTGVAASIFVGGIWYDALATWLGSRHLAFDALLLIAAAFTAGCWLLVPVMKRAGVQWR